MPRPFVAPFPYKYTSEKQKRIDQIHSIINGGKNSNAKLVRISEFSNSMLHNLENLPKRKEQPTISTTELSTKNIKQTEDDPCI